MLNPARCPWLLCLTLLAPACLAEHDDPPLASDEAEITTIIPSSMTCNQGLAGKQCVQVPPISTPAAARWTIDGVMAAHEYSGATEVPFTLDSGGRGGNGRVLIQRVNDTTPLATPSRFAYVFLDRVPVPIWPTGTDAWVDLYFDFARFDGVDKFVTGEDRRVRLNLLTGAASVQTVTGSGSTSSWTTIATPAGFVAAPGGCTVDSAASLVAFCSGELRLALPSSATSAPGVALAPGIGFFARHPEVRGSAPEVPSSGFSQTTRERTHWPTLLFARPRGFPLKIMTWNIRRFGDDTQSPGFDAVPEDEIGKFLAKNDVVTIQEGWDDDEVNKVLDAANTARADAGLPKFHLIGPGDFGAAKQAILTTVVSALESTAGGLYVMTHLPVVGSGYRAFPSSMCRGEDCLKAKGVMWTRLALNNPETADPTCLKGRGTSCDKPPSGDDYVDIFTTHLQADDPLLCGADFQAIKAAILTNLALLDVAPPFTTVLAALMADLLLLMDTDLNCYSLDDAEARAMQLDHMDKFVDAIQSERGDRAVILTGDFNIDGRDITGAEYRSMLQRLHIASPATPASDLISVLPAQFTFDIDHGDLARERTDLDFATGRCLGTSIDETGGSPDPGCPFDGNFDGKARLDYILVRPPTLPALATTDPRWIAMLGPQPWSSPFPSNGTGFGGPPDRLSDHKPVVSDVELAPLATPPKYHANWPHEVELRVTGINATQISDCPTCGPVDPYVTLRSATVAATVELDTIGDECTDDAWPSFPASGCTGNWFLKRTQAPSLAEVDLRTETWDDDDTSATDLLHELTRLVFDVDDGSGNGGFDLEETFFGLPMPSQVWPILDAAPYDRCGVIPPMMCYRLTLVEQPPGL
jgi:hypothetical protein